MLRKQSKNASRILRRRNDREVAMGQKTNPKIERVLALVEPGRRDALRKILATAAYAAPVVASFSLDAEAVAVDCLASNQTCLGIQFRGTVKCNGLRMSNRSLIAPRRSRRCTTSST
jgi:hypothetical protein